MPARFPTWAAARSAWPGWPTCCTSASRPAAGNGPGGRLVWDKPVLIQCYTTEDALERQAVPLREFLVEMGTETHQGAVGFVIDRDYYEIQFPPDGDA